MAKERSKLRPFVQIAAAAAVALSARASLADHYRVPSGSMEPTVQIGDRILVSKASYGLRLPMTSTWVLRFAGPSRGDVVVLEPPPNDAGTDIPRDPLTTDLVGSVLLKRVVAVEGDVVEVRGGRVWIDGAALVEPWISTAEGGGPDFGPIRVPEGNLLVLGDNRGNSRDGRTFGWAPRERVLGRAVAVVARDGRLTLQRL